MQVDNYILEVSQSDNAYYILKSYTVSFYRNKELVKTIYTDQPKMVIDVLVKKLKEKEDDIVTTSISPISPTITSEQLNRLQELNKWAAKADKKIVVNKIAEACAYVMENVLASDDVFPGFQFYKTKTPAQAVLEEVVDRLRAFRKRVLSNPIIYRGNQVYADDKTINALASYCSIGNFGINVNYEFKFPNKAFMPMNMEEAKKLLEVLFKFQQAAREAEARTHNYLEGLPDEVIVTYKCGDIWTGNADLEGLYNKYLMSLINENGLRQYIK